VLSLALLLCLDHAHRARAGVPLCAANHRIMRSGDPAERPTIQLTDDDYLAATRPLTPTHHRSVDPTSTSRRPLDERTLIDELWRISHFGWIPEAAIRRTLTLSRGQAIGADSVHHGLRRLLDRGCVEHRDSNGDTGEHHWRLTDSGRHARLG
jgi:hypothetical protein